MMWADQGYQGEELATWVKDTFGCELEIVKKTTKGFKSLSENSYSDTND